MTIGKILIGKPNKCPTVSGWDKSCTHRNELFRNSIADPSMEKNPKKIGIWISIGIQPENGLTPYSLYSFIISWFIRCGSSLYFWRSSVMTGESLDIRRMLLVE